MTASCIKMHHQCLSLTMSIENKQYPINIFFKYGLFPTTVYIPEIFRIVKQKIIKFNNIVMQKKLCFSC